MAQVPDGVDALAGRPPADQVGHQPRPSRLVRGTEPGAVVAVEVLVEDQVAAPGGVALEAVDPAEAGPPPVGPDEEQVDEPLAQVGGDPVKRDPGSPRRVLD